MPGESTSRLCQCFAAWCTRAEAAEDGGEEAEALLQDAERAAVRLSAAATGAEGRGRKAAEAEEVVRRVGQFFRDGAPSVLATDFLRTASRSLDLFKGALVVLMTFAHVDLCLMSPALQYFSAVPHCLGNAASGLCFLGFMFAYGFACDGAYLADSRSRTPHQQLWRLARSASLPVAAAWVCACAWGFMCFRLPMDAGTLLAILDFRVAVGNGPDFLLCFPACLLCAYPLRHAVGAELASRSAARRWLCVAAMLLGPLALTRCVLVDCTGLRKYLNYLLECVAREPWSPNLPALPHLFYFNLGVLLARSVTAFSAEVKGGRVFDMRKLLAAYVVISGVLMVLSYPLASVWASSYGNISVVTRWGTVSRGFSGGPSALWLLGNLFGLDVLLASCVALQLLAERSEAPVLGPLLRLLRSELQHLGANVLLYLVVADLCLAGLYRGTQGQFPLGLRGGATTTFGLLMVARFLHYLGASGRSGDAAPQAVA